MTAFKIEIAQKLFPKMNHEELVLSDETKLTWSIHAEITRLVEVETKLLRRNRKLSRTIDNLKQGDLFLNTAA